MKLIDRLLVDEEFIKWVKKPTAENDLFWSEWLKGNPDKLNDFNKAKILVQSFNYKKAPKDNERFNRVLNRILQEKSPIKYNRQKRKRRFINLRIETWVKIAAVVAFFLVFTFILRTNKSEPEIQKTTEYITKQNPPGQKSTILLPDSTVVTLNSGSRIIYPEKFTEEFRDVELIGEAFFEVYENIKNPFRVKTSDVYTIALGTSFNVKAFNNDSKTSIALNTGKVEVCGVDDHLNEPCVLSPGEKATYNLVLQQIIKSSFDPELELSWKDGILVFKQTNLDDFIQIIELWYGVNVKLIGNSKINISATGKFENNESLEVVLDILEFSRKVEHKFIDRKNVELLIKT